MSAKTRARASACALVFLFSTLHAAWDFEARLEKAAPKNRPFSAAGFIIDFTEFSEGKKEAEYCESELASLSAALKERLKGESGAEALKIVSAFMFEEMKFRFDQDADSEASRRAVNSFYRSAKNYGSFPEIFSSRRGICAGLSLVYMALAESAGVEVFPVFAPGHIYLRFESPKGPINIETTMAGRLTDGSFYRKNYPSTGDNCYGITMPRLAAASAAFSNLGFHYDALGRSREALSLHKKSVTLNPRLPDARVNLSAAYLKLAMYKEAEKEALEALKLFQGSAGAAVNLAAVYLRTGRYLKAAEIYETMVKKEPNNAQAFDGLGLALKEAGNYAKAAACFRRAVELDPANERAINNLGNIYTLQEKHADAVEAYKRSILLNPNRHESRMNLAAAYYSAGRYGASASEYERAAVLNPEGYYLYCNMGAAYHRLGRTREAEKAFKQALKIKPDDGLSLFNLGALYLEMDKPEAAVLIFEKAVKTDPDNKEALYNLGAAYEILGDPDKADYYREKSGLR